VVIGFHSGLFEVRIDSGRPERGSERELQQAGSPLPATARRSPNQKVSRVASGHDGQAAAFRVGFAWISRARIAGEGFAGGKGARDAYCWIEFFRARAAVAVRFFFTRQTRVRSKGESLASSRCSLLMAVNIRRGRAGNRDFREIAEATSGGSLALRQTEKKTPVAPASTRPLGRSARARAVGETRGDDISLGDVVASTASVGICGKSVTPSASRERCGAICENTKSPRPVRNMPARKSVRSKPGAARMSAARPPRRNRARAPIGQKSRGTPLRIEDRRRWRVRADASGIGPHVVKTIRRDLDHIPRSELKVPQAAAVRQRGVIETAGIVRRTLRARRGVGRRAKRSGQS